MRSDDRGRFGALLRRQRLAAALTQEELAERSGMSVRTISNLERGITGQPYPNTIAALARALGLSDTDRAQMAGTVQPVNGAQPPQQLPAAVSGFTGRKEELRKLSGVLDESSQNGGAVVISAIGGTAGVGKTALAVHWAHQVADRFPDGQLYVNLRGYDPGQPVPPGDALAAFLRTLGVPWPEIPAGIDERAARYRSMLAGRRLLVLLDNAGSAEQVRPLLPGTATCVAVVTSRDALTGLAARDGAHRLELAALGPAESAELLRTLIGDRASAEPAAVQELAAQCCHLPLALRIAAERAAALPSAPLASLVAELADQHRRLDLLDAGGDAYTAVRAVFSWSCQQLDPAAARMFRLAGTHPGPDFDVYAAAALTGTPVEQAQQEVGRLERAHLINATGPGRYTIHDLLGAYARELATSHDGDAGCRAALTRLFGYYLHTAAAAMATLYPQYPLPQPPVPGSPTPGPLVTTAAAARRWLDAERDALVAAVTYSAAQGWHRHATYLAVTVLRHLGFGGHFTEAIRMSISARDAARLIGDHGAEADVVNHLGLIDMQQGRYPEAIAHLEEARVLCRAAGNLAGEARSLINLGGITLNRGGFEQATRYYADALAVSHEIGFTMGEAHAYASLGTAHLKQGRYPQAARHHRRALRLFREIGDPKGQAAVLIDLGVGAFRQGQCQQAVSHYQEALTLSQENRDLPEQARCLSHFGEVDLRENRLAQAADRQQQALALTRQVGCMTSEGSVLSRLAKLDLRQGHYQQAVARHEQALAIIRETGNIAAEDEVLNGLGEALLTTGQPDQARGQFTAAIALASQIGDSYEQARACDGLGQALDALGDAAMARQHWRQALAIYTELGAPEAAQVREKLAAPGALCEALAHGRGARLGQPRPQRRLLGPPGSHLDDAQPGL